MDPRLKISRLCAIGRDKGILTEDAFADNLYFLLELKKEDIEKLVAIVRENVEG